MLRFLFRTSSTSKLIKNELETNPYFERAFPHLAENVPTPETPKVGWGQSLTFQKISRGLMSFEVTEENEKTFVEGFRTIPGPAKWLSEEDKERIHLQIDLKMDQLEDTGLSRQEILLNTPGGLPLSQDPVFQYLRRNKLAREMIIKPGEEFTAYKIVDYALRQDFGSDRTNVFSFEPVYENETNADYHYEVYNDKSYPQLAEPRDYYWKSDLEGKQKKYDRYFGRSLPFYKQDFLPKTKYYKKNKRQVSLKDIHFKNVDFLCQFLTDTGKILNRIQTKLPLKAQKKVAQAIKHARSVKLIPSSGYILPIHRTSLVPIHAQTFQDIAIHSETGAVLSKKQAGEKSLLNTIEHPNTVEKIAKRFKLDNFEEDVTKIMNKANDLINYDIQFFPNSIGIQILEAHKSMSLGEKPDPELEQKMNRIADETGSQTFHEKFIFEKATDGDLFSSSEAGDVKSSVEEGLAEILAMKRQFGLNDKVPRFYEDLANEISYKDS